MALQQSFSASVSDDGLSFIISDDTGTYDAISNPTGYGSPNTPRTDLAIFVISNYKALSGDQLLSYDAYDPEIATTWTSSGASGGLLDGHYETKVYSVPRSGTEGAAVLNHFRHDFGTNQLERYNGSTWVSAVTADLATYDYAHQLLNDPIVTSITRALNNINRLYILGCKTCSKTDIQKYIIDTQIAYDAIFSLFAEGSYAQAQENIEKYQSRVDQLIELV